MADDRSPEARALLAIANALGSLNVLDSNLEPAGIVDVLAQIASALRNLGNADAATPMGALEAHGVALRDAGTDIAHALHDVAAAIREATDRRA